MSSGEDSGEIAPNIIWIFGDQHRAQALGCNGNKIVRTPNIDELAKNGVNFVKAVCGFPLCCPMRGSLLTSKYPHESVPGHEYQMPIDLTTIADVFNEAGYRTSYFGKWHLDGAHERWEDAAEHYVPPERRGSFKTWIGYDNNNKPWDCLVHGHDEDGNEIEHYKLDGYETDKTTDLFFQYLENHVSGGREEPFFSVISVQPPHSPYFGPEDKMEHYYQDEFLIKPIQFELRKNVPDIPEIKNEARKSLASYYSMIEQIDVNVGRLKQVLIKKGIWANTCLVFFSDHGDMHQSHGHSYKTTPHEESIRIPFIIGGGFVEERLKGEKHKQVQALINHVDIAPTTLGLAGLTIPASMVGFNYSTYIEKDLTEIEDKPRAAYIQSVVPTGHGDCIDKPWRGIITEKGWKYVCFNECDWMMFDLNRDPYELINLAHYFKHNEKKITLQNLLRDCIKKTGDDFNVPHAVISKDQVDKNEKDSILRRWKCENPEEFLHRVMEEEIDEKEKDVSIMRKIV